MSSISDLPPEILDHVFDYLGTADQTSARLVCHQWNEQLSSLRYRKKRKLRLTFDSLKENPSDMQWLAKSIGKHHCIEVDWFTIYNKLNGHAIKNCTARLVDVLNANRFSLEELSLRNCSWTTLRAVFGALGRQRRLRNLKVQFNFYNRMVQWARVPRVRNTVSDVAGCAFVKNLEVSLVDDSCVELVSSFASQLTHLTLGVRGNKRLLLRCLNETHMHVLNSLSLESVGRNGSDDDLIQPEELGGGCWRMLAKLENFRCCRVPMINILLEVMLPHCQKLKCLTIVCYTIPIRCLEQICALKGLKDVHLEGFFFAVALTFNLPNLEHFHLENMIGLRLDRQMPRLNSVVLGRWARKEILWDLTKIVGISGRRFRKIQLTEMNLDKEATGWLTSLSIDVLSLDRCYIDMSLFDALAEPQTSRRIFRVEMDNCVFTFDKQKSYSVVTVSQLRAKCPLLQISTSGTRVRLGEGNYQFDSLIY